MGRRKSVFGNNRPVIIQPLDIVSSKIDHRFYGQCHTRHQLYAAPVLAKVGDLRILMKRSSYPVSYKISDYSVSVRLYKIIYRI